MPWNAADLWSQGSYTVLIHTLLQVGLTWPQELAVELSLFYRFPCTWCSCQELLFPVSVSFSLLKTQVGWSLGSTECIEKKKKKLFDSCSLNTISFRADLRALPSKYSATGSRLRVQATLWVNFNRWKFFLGYSNIPNPDQPWRGSVLTRKMSECGNGSPHWESKTHILLMVGWGLSCPHTKKSMWHSFRTKVSRDPLWKGAHFLIERPSEACSSVSSVGGCLQSHGGLLSLLLVFTPRQHSLVKPAQLGIEQASHAYHFSPRPVLQSLMSEGVWKTDNPK